MFCYYDQSTSMTVAVQLVSLHLFTSAQETIIYNSYLSYIQQQYLYCTHTEGSLHFVIISFTENFYNSHEFSSCRTPQTRIAQPFLHIRSFCILPLELNVRLDEGKQLDPHVPIPYCSLWLHWRNKLELKMFSTDFCRDGRHDQSQQLLQMFLCLYVVMF